MAFVERKQEKLLMEITVHHTVGLSGSAVFAIVLIAAVVAFCTFYPMVASHPVVPSEPSRGPMGFQPPGK